ncbi:MAG: redox-regulated ATPase YchF [Chloroflexi bacterium]|nr:redox-regulated ATPase YchF [Chloroflexota bacterium]
MQIALIGLPQSGKSTLSTAMTQGRGEASGSRRGRVEIRSAVVDVPDARVDRLTEMFHPRRTVYAQVRVDDVTGVSRGSAGQSGFDPQVLDALSRSDALMMVVRAFEDDAVPHPEVTVDPVRDVEIIMLELIMSDLTIVEHRVERIEAQIPKTRADARDKLEQELALMRRLAEALSRGEPVRRVPLAADEEVFLRSFQFLTAKPAMIVLNMGEDAEAYERSQYPGLPEDEPVLGIRGALEMEIAELPEDERALFLESYGIEEPGLNVLLRECYALLGLMSFFTVGEDEVRAWTVRRGAVAVEAAGAIHTDLARGFIRAEVIGYDDMLACGTMAEARKRGRLRLEGKDYVVQNGDILNIRFNV